MGSNKSNNSSAEIGGCEGSVLDQLGSTSSYESTSYLLDVTWQPQYDALWPSLGCLSSVQSFRLSGSPSNKQFPGAWADNGSFPMLKQLYIDLPSEGPELTGTLPSSWGQPTAFPPLTTLSIASTELTGTVPDDWAVLVYFLEVLHLLTPNFKGVCFACFAQHAVRLMVHQYCPCSAVSLCCMVHPGLSLLYLLCTCPETFAALNFVKLYVQQGFLIADIIGYTAEICMVFQAAGGLLKPSPPWST